MVKRNLPDKFTLRASVAIAEWMNRVKFTKIIGGPIRKFGGITVCQMSIRAEALESLIQDGRDLLVNAKKNWPERAMLTWRNLPAHG